MEEGRGYFAMILARSYLKKLTNQKSSNNCSQCIYCEELSSNWYIM